MEKVEKTDETQMIDGLTLADCLVLTGWPQNQVDAMTTEVQRRFVAKKVSVESSIPTTELTKYNNDELASMCPLTKRKSRAAAQVQLVTKLMEDRTYPPTIFVHMPRDSVGEVQIAKSMCQLEHQNVRTAELQVYPKRASIRSLVDYGFSEANAQKIIDAWKEFG